MNDTTIKELAFATGGEIISGNENAVFSNIVIDSRQADKDSLFVPLVGEKNDAHKFLESVYDMGCRVAISSRKDIFLKDDFNIVLVNDTTEALQKLGKYIRSKLTLPLVGVTGSVGKTTTREMVALALSDLKVFKTPNNFNSQVGVPITLSRINDEEIGVIELGMSQFGEMERIAKIVNCDCALVTNIGTAHIENLHTRENIRAEKFHIMDGMKKAGTSNPVMVLDEIDKLASSYNGDPASALLEVLDPEQNNTFTDHYMNVPYDLSDVLFVCTANSLDTIPGPLLDRMEVIRFTGYTALEKFSIAKDHLIPKAKKKAGISEDNLIIEDETIKALINGYTMEAGVRGLKKQISALCRHAAVELVKNNKEILDVKPEELQDYLDQRPIRHESILEKKQAGVVTGLAWTAVGGEILFIETMLTKGKGKVKITGQLGDVMKESVDIALSLVKNMYPESHEVFENNDIHIHVPAGAVPKDGPSAGITMTTALSSLVNNIPVSPEYAMTGEVSLRGNVMPIGGLPEKLMAAARAGIKKVFIPDENKDDLKEVAEEVLNELEIIPVKKVEDVLSIVLK
mgnify:CR=1 FL=1